MWTLPKSHVDVILMSEQRISPLPHLLLRQIRNNSLLPIRVSQMVPVIIESFYQPNRFIH